MRTARVCIEFTHVTWLSSVCTRHVFVIYLHTAHIITCVAFFSDLDAILQDVSDLICHIFQDRLPHTVVGKSLINAVASFTFPLQLLFATHTYVKHYYHTADSAGGSPGGREFSGFTRLGGN